MGLGTMELIGNRSDVNTTSDWFRLTVLIQLVVFSYNGSPGFSHFRDHYRKSQPEYRPSSSLRQRDGGSQRNKVQRAIFHKKIWSRTYLTYDDSPMAR